MRRWRQLRSRWFRALGVGAGLVAGAVLGAPLLAHGESSELPALDPGSALGSWAIDPPLDLLLLLAGAAFLWAAVRVNARRPRAAFSGWRVAAWFGGLLATWFALQSFVDVYATTLFSVHMVQHLLLVAVAAPLFVLAAPVTLALRVASPGLRRGWVLPLLHSRLVRFVGHPVAAWFAFAGVMWVSHFSPLFDAALEDPLVHQLEHLLFLGAAVLFWWPVVGADPSPGRLSYAGRLAYLIAALPQNSFLGAVIYFAPQVLYHHYATIERTWGPAPLEDQALAGGIMWTGGDLAFLVALLAVVAALLADEERKGRLADARMDAEAAARRR